MREVHVVKPDSLLDSMAARVAENWDEKSDKVCKHCAALWLIEAAGRAFTYGLVAGLSAGVLTALVTWWMVG
jgi:hypothetical protein